MGLESSSPEIGADFEIKDGLVVPRDLGITQPGGAESATPGPVWSGTTSTAGSEFSVGQSGLSQPTDLGLSKGTGRRSEVIIPKDAEAIAALTRREPVEKKRFSASDLALAITNLPLFLNRQVQPRLVPEPVAREIGEHLLTGDFNEYSAGAIKRVEKVKKYYDKNSGEKEELVVSSPGPLERACLVLSDLLTTPELRDAQIVTETAKTLHRLIQTYRTKVGSFRDQEGLNVLPEMPDLVNSLTKSLESTNLRVYPWVRQIIYETLEQLSLGDSQAEAVLASMKRLAELSQPLAFRLEMNLATSLRSEKSLWLAEQRQIRERALNLLRELSTPQALCDAYLELRELVRDLVISEDPLSPYPGKIGMDLEFARKTHTYPGVPKGFNLLPYEVNKTWEIQLEENDEIKVDEDYLQHDRGYLLRISKLRSWLLSTSQNLSGLHVHLDRLTHSQNPRLGYLLGDTVLSESKEGGLYTYEVRGLNPTGMVHGLKPQVLADFIGLHIEAAKDQEPDPVRTERLRIKSPETRLDQLVFGHLCRILPTAEGRLSALMVLKDAYALSAISPEALYNSYDPQDFQAGLRPILERELIGHRQTESFGRMLKQLEFLRTVLSKQDFGGLVLNHTVFVPHFLASEDSNWFLGIANEWLSELSQGSPFNNRVRNLADLLDRPDADGPFGWLTIYFRDNAEELDPEMLAALDSLTPVYGSSEFYDYVIVDVVKEDPLSHELAVGWLSYHDDDDYRKMAAWIAFDDPRMFGDILARLSKDPNETVRGIAKNGLAHRPI